MTTKRILVPFKNCGGTQSLPALCNQPGWYSNHQALSHTLVWCFLLSMDYSFEFLLVHSLIISSNITNISTLTHLSTISLRQLRTFLCFFLYIYISSQYANLSPVLNYDFCRNPLSLITTWLCQHYSTAYISNSTYKQDSKSKFYHHNLISLPTKLISSYLDLLK